jgi:hypothetical protein
MNIMGELIAKILETPEVVNQIKKSLVNRDLAVEIDGKRFQIMTKRDDDEVDNLKAEIKDLKSKLYDLESSLRDILLMLDNNMLKAIIDGESGWKYIVKEASKLTK